MTNMRQRLPQRSSGGGSRFTYQRRDQTDVQVRQKTYASGGRDAFIPADIDTYASKKGENWLRILPPTWPNAKHYGLDVYVHYGIGPDSNSFLCVDKMQNKPCLICEERSRLAAAGHEEAASELRPTFRLMTWVLDRKERKAPQLWMMPMTVDKELIVLCQDARTGEVLWIDDPDNGYDIEFSKQGEQMMTKYVGVRIARNSSPVGDDAALDFIQSKPLPSLLIYPDEEVIRKALAGMSKTPQPREERGGGGGQTQSAPARGGREQARAPQYSPEEIFNTALDASNKHGIEVPDSVSDADLPKYVAERLGANLRDYPQLSSL